jgi:hypothetical protein
MLGLMKAHLATSAQKSGEYSLERRALTLRKDEVTPGIATGASLLIRNGLNNCPKTQESLCRD